MPQSAPAKQLRQQVTRFWRDMEFFRPFDLDDVQLYYGTRAIPMWLNRSVTMPWEDPEFYQLDCEREYAFDLFLAPFLKREILRCVSETLPNSISEFVPDSRELSGLSCVVRLTLTDEGRIDPGDLSLSTLPWALDSLFTQRPLSVFDFDNYADTFRSLLMSRTQVAGGLQNETSNPIIRAAELNELAERLRASSNLKLFPEELLGIIVPHRLGKRHKQQPEGGEIMAPTVPAQDLLRRKRKVDILNSFCLRDLERVSGAFDKGEPAVLCRYFNGLEETQARVDLFAPAAAIILCQTSDPKAQSRGRWVDSRERFNSLHQQLALNLYASPEIPLHAVNGPPGTGKTTLVRDLIANVVVQRAIVLSQLQRPQDAFSSGFIEATIGSRKVSFRTLRRELVGHEIVIASSNNGAVENISKKLPERRALGAAFADLNYLSPIAKLYRIIEGQDAEDQAKSTQDGDEFWGLPSVALGNSKNRKLFRMAAFTGPSEESKKVYEERIASGASTLFEWRKQAPQNASSFFQARSAFSQKLTQLQEFNDSQSGIDSLDPRDPQTQIRAPWLSLTGNQLRAELFAAALGLQESWLREVPQFERELFALSSLIGNPQGVAPTDAAALWALMFMVVPVVSTTLASVERMFAPLAAESLGHVVIDEAAQASPQLAAGLLMRAKRALIVGDQRQLEPICTIPRAIERYCGSELPPEVLKMVSPLESSVQSLADAQAQYGTYFGTGVEATWVGLPLCAHRRCQDPMFSIANTIAYDNRMIFASGMPKSSALDQRLGESAWCLVKGDTTVKQWVPEHGELCKELLIKCIAGAEEFPDIFFITPFREVRRQLISVLSATLRQHGASATMRKELKRRIGTIHTFQGKEADVVFLVLGCDFKTGRAADWAGERPNLVNVAVTRARTKLFVIGDVDVWHNRGFFSDLEKSLPKRVWVGADG